MFVIVSSTGSPLKFGDPVPPDLPQYNSHNAVKIASALRREIPTLDAVTKVKVHIQIVDLATGKVSNVDYIANNIVYISSDISNTSCGKKP